MNPANRYTTSLMDIILGAIGAFFFLLIILSASRRGITQEGVQFPPNAMTLTVVQPAELKREIGKSIHYFVAQLRRDNLSEIDKIFYSDVKIDENAKEKLIDVYPSTLSMPMILAPENPPKIIIGVWLQDVFVQTKPEVFPKEPVKISITCRKICEVRPSGSFSLELKQENNYVAVYVLNDGSPYDDAAKLQYQGQKILNSGLPCRSTGEEWTPGEEIKTNIEIKTELGWICLCHVHNIGEDKTKHYFYKEFGHFRPNSEYEKKVPFRFVEEYHSPQDATKDPREAIITCLNMMGEDMTDKKDQSQITYLAAGERAVCVVLQDGSLQFRETEGKQLNYYPFAEYGNGHIPKEKVDKMIDRMRQIETGLQKDKPDDLKRMLAEIIAGQNDRKAPYPAVRQNPLLWK